MVNPHVDELSMMTYLSQFPEAKLKDGAPIKARADPSKVSVYYKIVPHNEKKCAIDENTTL